MKKDNKTIIPQNKKALKQEPESSATKNEQIETNKSFPQEYEEQRSMDIRMKPQPYIKPKKDGG